jgi:hypothetical protein
MAEVGGQDPAVPVAGFEAEQVDPVAMLRRLAETSEHAGVLACAATLIETWITVDQLTPAASVRVLDLSAEQTRTRELLSTLSHWDEHEGARPLEDLQGELVSRSRALGLSWDKIGKACGVSQQAIMQKASSRGWAVASLVGRGRRSRS